MKFIGADGCRRGWVAVVFDGNLARGVEIFETIDALWEHHHDASRILLDIPIGLPFSRRRECDTRARRLLKTPRASSVFPVPCRPAVYAEHYESACDENRKALGAGLSIQTWCITRKIREVDEFLCIHHNNRAEYERQMSSVRANTMVMKQTIGQRLQEARREHQYYTLFRAQCCGTRWTNEVGVPSGNQPRQPSGPGLLGVPGTLGR